MAATLSPDLMKGLRLLILTGEVVRMDDIQRWWGHTQLLSVYRNSECGGYIRVGIGLTKQSFHPNIGLRFHTAVE